MKECFKSPDVLLRAQAQEFFEAVSRRWIGACTCFGAAHQGSEGLEWPSVYDWHLVWSIFDMPWAARESGCCVLWGHLVLIDLQCVEVYCRILMRRLESVHIYLPSGCCFCPRHSALDIAIVICCHVVRATPSPFHKPHKFLLLGTAYFVTMGGI